EKLRAGQAGPNSAFDDWIVFFQHWHEENIMGTITHEPVKQALAELQRLSGDEDSRRAAFVRERALIDERSELQVAERRGEQRGEQRGIEIGKLEGKQEAHIETALKMIRANQFGDAMIAEFTGLTEDEVRQLRAQA
nr:hypothetical protein [Zoogloeaceae bacterium]